MKYRFEIMYANKNLKVVNDFMRKLDLSIEGMAIKNVVTFESNKDLHIGQVKELIKQGYELNDCTIYHIEGGKVE